MRSVRHALATLFLPMLVQACSNSEEVVLGGDPEPSGDAGAVTRVDGGERRDAGPTRTDVPLAQRDATASGDVSSPVPERCNGEDDDGDGMIDETCACAPVSGAASASMATTSAIRRWLSPLRWLEASGFS